MVTVVSPLSVLPLGAVAFLVLGVQYRRGAVPTGRGLLVVGALLGGLWAVLVDLSHGGPVETGTTLDYVLDGVALLAAVAGPYAIYRGWRTDDAAIE